jgi:hypothetical protein
MKVLVACEESQVVCKAFRALGHEAYSCDIQDCSGGKPEWHIKGDVLDVINGGAFTVAEGYSFADEVIVYGWDLMIAHPPCTYLTNSGVQHLYKGERWKDLIYGAVFFRKLLDAPIPFIAAENPIPHKYASAIIGTNYSQLIQPYEFGHTERKATCLWLKNLPLLVATNNVKKEMDLLPKSQQQRLHYLSPGPERAKLRSKTFEGIAQAMATQWGQYLQLKQTA